MSLEDPFYTVRDDVRGSLKNAEQLHSQWRMLLDGQSDFDKLQAVTTDLRSCIKSIEWDLQDLDETIGIAEANPLKFRLSQGELEGRKHFINDTRSIVNRFKNDMNSDSTHGVMEIMRRKKLMSSGSQKRGKGRYEKLEAELERSNQDYIDNSQHQQQVLMVTQDKQLDRVGDTMTVLHQMGTDIGVELDEQNRLIDEIDEDMQRTETRLTSLTKRVNKAIKNSSDRCQIICIIILVVVIVIVLVMFFVPF